MTLLGKEKIYIMYTWMYPSPVKIVFDTRNLKRKNKRSKLPTDSILTQWNMNRKYVYSTPCSCGEKHNVESIKPGGASKNYNYRWSKLI